MVRALNIAAPPSLLTGWAPPRDRGPPLGAPRRHRTGQARPAPRLARREEVWWAGCSARAGGVPGAARRSCGGSLEDRRVRPRRTTVSPWCRTWWGFAPTSLGRSEVGVHRHNILLPEAQSGLPRGSFSISEELRMARFRARRSSLGRPRDRPISGRAMNTRLHKPPGDFRHACASK